MLPLRVLLLGIFVIVVFAGNGVAIKVAVTELPPMTAIAVRFALTALCFLPFARWPGKDKFWMICQISMLMCVLHQGSLFISFSYLSASLATILLQTQVIFSTILGALLFKEHIGWRTISGILIGMLGVVVLVGMPEETPNQWGLLAMLFSMITLCFAYARMKGLPQVEPADYIAYLHLFAAPIMVATAFAVERPMAIETIEINYLGLGLALLYQVTLVSIAHMIWQRLMAHHPMSILPTLTLLMPFFGVGFAVALLGDELTWPMVYGGLITVLGVTIIVIRRAAKKKDFVDPLPVD